MNNAYETLKEFFEKRGDNVESFSNNKVRYFLVQPSVKREYVIIVSDIEGGETTLTFAISGIPLNFHFTACEIEDDNHLVFKRKGETVGSIKLVY